MLNNCILSENGAGLYGGGADECTLNNCLLTGNRRGRMGGGGAHGGMLNNCTVVGNVGGTSFSTANNSIIYSNDLQDWLGTGPDYQGGTLNYCCTTPLPTNGIGNITNKPLFMDVTGNFRLQADSPCINAGNNAFALGSADLDGNPRILGGTVDIGAYEFQSPTSLLSYYWLHQYGMPTDGSADYADPDADGLNNWQEWRCQTDPLNSFSALRLVSALPTGNSVAVTWQSVDGVNYSLERSTNMAVATGFTTIATNIVGRGSATVYADTNTCESSAFSAYSWTIETRSVYIEGNI